MGNEKKKNDQIFLALQLLLILSLQIVIGIDVTTLSFSGKILFARVSLAADSSLFSDFFQDADCQRTSDVI